MNVIEELSNRNYWMQKTISSVLKLSLEPISLKEQIEGTLDLILAVPWLSLEAKGCIFLAAEDRPVLHLTAQRQLPAELLNECANIPFGHCLCGQAAARGQTVFASRLDERHTVRYQGIQEHGHYCIPILSGNRLLGVINTYISPDHKRDENEEEFLKAIANTLSGVIERKRAEEALRKAKDELDVTVENLKLSLEPISLKRQMERTLDLILSIPWLALESRGCIFLIGDDQQSLEMIAQRGIAEPLQEACARVAFGKCLCGRAAVSRELVFADHLDERHEISYEGIQDHGHYCTPIVFGNQLLGVINLYIAKDHKRNRTEEDFIRSVADTLAGVIKRKQAEIALQRANEELEAIVRKRTFKLRQLHRQNKLILDAVADGICGVNEDGVITFINPAALDITGYDSEDLIGRDFHNVLHGHNNGTPQHSREDCPIIEAIVTGRTQVVVEEMFSKKDGTSFPVEYGSIPMWEKNKIIGAVVTFRDITNRRQAEEKISHTLERLSNALHSTVDALSIASETRDPYTAGHQRRVAQLACAIAREMGLDQEKIAGLHVAALLHDIGKIYVPAEFLAKPGRLTDIERTLLKTHTTVGYDILKSIVFPWPVAEIVLQHHEKINGSGYPRGLAGEEILVEARIISVADVIEAMASHRPYRPALGIDLAMQEISSKAGMLYDHKVVEACAQLFIQKIFSFETTDSKEAWE